MIVTEWFRRLWYLINRRRFERALQQDMDAHREALGGKRPFGNTLHIREQAREVWGWRWLDDLWRDLVYGANSLLRTPGFALSAIVVLALGMGVNLTEFQMMDAVIHHLQVHDGAGRMLLLIGTLSAVATLIASSGIFGLIAFTVSQRTHEIGGRRALGATGVSILETVLRQYLAPVCVGLLAGVAIEFAGARILEAARPGMPRFELLSYTAALLVFLVLAFIAATLPCRKALKMEPAAVLRHD